MAELPKRDGSAGQNRRLAKLQCGRIGKDQVRRQQQIIKGRGVDRKVGEHLISLAGGERQPGFLHLVEHLDENSKVKARRPEGEVPENREASHIEKKQEGGSDKKQF